jgi:hypothetical protein
MKILDKLDKLDRRWLYVMITAVVIVPLIIKPKAHPTIIFPEVNSAYATLEKVPADKLVIVSCIWGPGTQAENGPQTEAIYRHLFMSNKKFAVIAWDPTGSTLTYEMGKRVADELGKKYGTDWVHFGYRVPIIYSTVKSMAQDFQKTFSKDRNGTPTSELPVTKNIKGSKQIGAVVEITPSSTLESWIAYFNGPYNVPLIYCPTAVMATEAFPYLDSKQIQGMLNGVIGAAQYETLIGEGDKATEASSTAWALSGAHVFIVLLIMLGNVLYFFQVRKRKVDK